jgi:hypothetical protein
MHAVAENLFYALTCSAFVATFTKAARFKAPEAVRCEQRDFARVRKFRSVALPNTKRVKKHDRFNLKLADSISRSDRLLHVKSQSQKLH